MPCARHERPSHAPSLVNHVPRAREPRSQSYSWRAAQLRHINDYLVRWAMRKYKGLHWHADRARRWLHAVAGRPRALFAHWWLGLVP